MPFRTSVAITGAVSPDDGCRHIDCAIRLQFAPSQTPASCFGGRPRQVGSRQVLCGGRFHPHRLTHYAKYMRGAPPFPIALVLRRKCVRRGGPRRTRIRLKSAISHRLGGLPFSVLSAARHKPRIIRAIAIRTLRLFPELSAATRGLY